MHGDRVLVRIARIEAGGRADGEIVKVLKRAHPTVVGEFRIAPPRRSTWSRTTSASSSGSRFPKAWRFPPPGALWTASASSRSKVHRCDDLDGMIVNVELLEYPGDGGQAVGRVIEILGRPDDFGVDVEIVIRKHHLPHSFPPEVMEQAQRCPTIIAAAELEGRRDFRDMPIVTIDGETARDFDDAVWVDRLANGNFALHVHIADVEPLRAARHADRRRGAAARHQRLFSRSRRADAAVRAFHQYLLAESAGGPAGALGAAGDRSPGRDRGAGVHVAA